MAAEEDDFPFGPVEDEEAAFDEEDLAAAAKKERAKRKEAGDWTMDRIIEHGRIKQLEICRKYRESLGGLVDPNAERKVAPNSPMRHVGAGKGGPELCTSLNVFAVKLLKTSLQYPLDIYGHVLVRDDLDVKRVFLFRRDRDNCQKINSAEDGLLSLTGPSRGILLHSDLLIEISLKVKSRDAESDTEIANYRLHDKVAALTTKVVRSRVVSELCSIEVTYAPVRHAVEATFQLTLGKINETRTKPNGSTTQDWQPFNKNKEEHRKFLGKISVSITGVPQSVVLYDSTGTGSGSVGEDGLIKLARRVVAVPLGSVMSINTVSLDGENVASFIPRTCGNDTVLACAGSYSLDGRIVWSTLYSPMVDDIFEDVQAVKQARQPALLSVKQACQPSLSA